MRVKLAQVGLRDILQGIGKGNESFIITRICQGTRWLEMVGSLRLYG